MLLSTLIEIIKHFSFRLLYLFIRFVAPRGVCLITFRRFFFNMNPMFNFFYRSRFGNTLLPFKLSEVYHYHWIISCSIIPGLLMKNSLRWCTVSSLQTIYSSLSEPNEKLREKSFVICRISVNSYRIKMLRDNVAYGRKLHILFPWKSCCQFLGPSWPLFSET